MPIPLDYPDAPVQPVDLEVGGVTYTDPYTG